MFCAVPLKNHKEHFQSFWCQLTYEICNEFPKYLVRTRFKIFLLYV